MIKWLLKCKREELVVFIWIKLFKFIVEIVEGYVDVVLVSKLNIEKCIE